MITQLTVQNFGLIDNLTIEFYEQLNILTGETGAGKSILIDALRYGLGGRLDPAQIRNPQIPCTVEIVLDLSKNNLNKNRLFAEFISGEDPSLIINRSYMPNNRSKIKINGFAVTLSQLTELGNHLIDFHGPHDHQMLLTPESHMGILDRLSKIEEITADYQGKYKSYIAVNKKIEEIASAAASKDRDIELLSQQIKELEQVPLETEKYEELMQKQAMINNREKLFESINTALQIFENDQGGVMDSLRQISNSIRVINNIDPGSQDISLSLNNIQESTNQFLYELQEYRDRLSFDGEEAEKINTKADIYYAIKRKYGPSFEDARNYYKKIKEKFNFLSNLEHNDTLLQKEAEEIKHALLGLAQKISQKRKQTAKELKETIEKELTELGIKHVQFECKIHKIDLNENGQDEVIFYISPNIGEELKPLSSIVSSGEAARVMLALKKALIKVDPIPVLIFDEIDSQIGGRLGTITGKKLSELSKNRQVILITHLPQIASFANAHFKITKATQNNRTNTTAELLSAEERIKELAKMMSGERETQIALKHAAEMLELSKKS